jgi:hypothetical protein
MQEPWRPSSHSFHFQHFQPFSIMDTKTWIIRLEITLKADSNPRKFISEAVMDCLNPEDGEDVADCQYICLD